MALEVVLEERYWDPVAVLYFSLISTCCSHSVYPGTSGGGFLGRRGAGGQAGSGAAAPPPGRSGAGGGGFSSIATALPFVPGASTLAASTLATGSLRPESSRFTRPCIGRE
jgi:hypothetical protein